MKSNVLNWVNRFVLYWRPVTLYLLIVSDWSAGKQVFVLYQKQYVNTLNEKILKDFFVYSGQNTHAMMKSRYTVIAYIIWGVAIFASNISLHSVTKPFHKIHSKKNWVASFFYVYNLLHIPSFNKRKSLGASLFITFCIWKMWFIFMIFIKILPWHIFELSRLYIQLYKVK